MKKLALTNDIITTTLDHCFGNDRHGWASAAAFVKRAQLHDRLRIAAPQWGKYPVNRMAWFSNDARFLGIGVKPTIPLRRGEQLLQIRLPFDGCGRELHRAARVSRSLKRDIAA